VDLSKQTQAYLEVTGPLVGDCWRTAIACLLELPRDDVPHFIQLHLGKDNLDWWWDTVRFVEQVKPGLTLVTVPPIFPIYNNPEAEHSSVVITGKSPRGSWNHCVLGDAKTAAILWDPHPTGAGIVNMIEVAALTEKENGYDQ
jgi:hypothetical protein